jgi:hypothetical protein
MMELAIAGLKSRMGGSVGTPPAQTLSGNAAPAADSYASMAEVTADMKKPEYKKDPAFRARVQAKLDRSTFLNVRTMQ